ncbi:MAG: hypothetical protein ACOYJ6_20675, partial [Caulobacterales bacterium]
LGLNGDALDALLARESTEPAPRRVALASAPTRGAVALETVERPASAPVLVLAHSAPAVAPAPAPAPAKPPARPERKSLMTILRAGPRAIKTPIGIRIPDGVAPGVLAEGELGFFGPGDYELIFETKVTEPDPQIALTLRIEYANAPILEQHFTANALAEKHRQNISLALHKPAHLKGAGPLRVSFEHHGGQGISLNHLIVY